MENVPNVSSEQELLGLLREGKITEDEYNQLLEAMRKSPPSEPQGNFGVSGKRFFWIVLAATIMVAAIAAVLGIFLIGLPRKVDLAIGKDGFVIQPYKEGAFYTVTVAIVNRGQRTSPEFGVYFYRGDPGKVAPMTHCAGPIKPGGMWRERTLPFALNEGPNHIEVVLDPDNLVAEIDETNNRASLKVVVSESEIVEKTPSYSREESE